MEKDNFKNEFSKRLKMEIKRAGFTQEQFAKLINVSKDTVGAYLNKNKDNLPDIYKLKDICEKLGCSPEYLMCMKDEKEMNIFKDLGLSRETQSILRRWKKKSHPGELSYLEILNNILFQNVSIFERFLFHLEKYVSDHLIFGADENGTVEEILISNVDMSYYQTLHSFELNELFLLQLQFDLNELKKLSSKPSR